jgi:hypothetical protein
MSGMPGRATVRFSPALTVLAVSFSAAASPTPPPPRPVGPAQVVIAAETLDIRVNDPLVIKVTLDNRTREPIVLGQPFGNVFGTVQFEICRGAGEDYVRTGAKNAGKRSLGMLSPYMVPPGTSVVCYEILFRWRSAFVFPAAGDWKLRAVVRGIGTTATRATYTSAPVTIHVRPRDDKEDGGVWENAERLDIALLSFGHGGDHGDPLGIAAKNRSELLRVAPKLGDSNLKRAINRIAALYAVGTAVTDDQRDRALADLGRLRGQLSEVAREHLDLKLVRIHLGREDAESAERLLVRIGERSYERDGLDIRLASLKARRPDGPPKP